MHEWNLREPTRQSVLGVLVYLLRNLRGLISLFVALLLIGAAQPVIWIIIGVALLPGIVIVSIIAYWQYRNFTFHMEEDDLIIHQGIFFKERTVISADRIQSIRIAQNLLQRLLGLVALKVDTAGSGGAELVIPALERPKAVSLKELLYSKKEAALAEGSAEEGSESEGTGTEAQGAPQDGATVRPKAPARILVKLGLGDLLLVGLTENHLRTGFVALAVMFGYVSQYQEFIERYFSDYFDEYANELANAGIAFALGALIVYAVLSVALSLIRTFLRFFNLRAALHSDAVEIETGLLKRESDRIPLRKVQFVEWKTNPLRRLVGFESARLHPSNSVGDVSKQERIEIPALRRAQSGMLAEGLFPAYVPPRQGLKADPAAYVRISCIVSSFLIVPALFVLYSWLQWQAAFILLLYLPIAFLAWMYGRRVRLHFDRSHILLRKGWIFPSRMVLPLHKLQCVSIISNIFLERRSLCHLSMHTAAGSRTVRYMKRDQVSELYNYLIYCIETSDKDWM